MRVCICVLLVMTNLDSILKSRGPLPTNVRLVKAVVFPVVMYGCEELASLFVDLSYRKMYITL